mmetsp:Transcript_55916/g.130939  ORF Transcript_55916/g.130939 Transcript_55916/m.130939 type:complete len:212 (+) Transcript_55916:59-694(+)
MSASAELEALCQREQLLTSETNDLKRRLRRFQTTGGLALALHKEVVNVAKSQANEPLAAATELPEAAAAVEESVEALELRREVEQMEAEAEALERQAAAAADRAKMQAEAANEEECAVLEGEVAGDHVLESPEKVFQVERAVRKLQKLDQLLKPMHEKVIQLSSAKASPTKTAPCAVMRCRPIGRSDVALRQRTKAVKLLLHRYQLRCAGY